MPELIFPQRQRSRFRMHTHKHTRREEKGRIWMDGWTSESLARTHSFHSKASLMLWCSISPLYSFAFVIILHQCHPELRAINEAALISGHGSQISSPTVSALCTWKICSTRTQKQLDCDTIYVCIHFLTILHKNVCPSVKKIYFYTKGNFYTWLAKIFQKQSKSPRYFRHV